MDDGFWDGDKVEDVTFEGEDVYLTADVVGEEGEKNEESVFWGGG